MEYLNFMKDGKKKSKSKEALEERIFWLTNQNFSLKLKNKKLKKELKHTEAHCVFYLCAALFAIFCLYFFNCFG